MARSRSAQVHVLIVRAPDGRVWAMGTPSQRGFTEAGAKSAAEQMSLRLPRNWTLTMLEITPIDEVVSTPPPPGTTLHEALSEPS